MASHGAASQRWPPRSSSATKSLPNARVRRRRSPRQVSACSRSSRPPRSRSWAWQAPRISRGTGCRSASRTACDSDARVTDDGFAQGLIGVTLDGRYRLDAVLGEGGMGSVFRATQLAMDRKVAVKLLKPHLVSDEQALQRFAREARATLKVDSPHAVKVLDFGVTPMRDYYMVLEYLDGRTGHRELEIDG